MDRGRRRRGRRRAGRLARGRRAGRTRRSRARAPLGLAMKPRGVGVAALLAASAALVVTARPARGALPRAYGGLLRVPAPAPIGNLHPAQVRTPFEACLAHALFDALYVLDATGAPRPHLAAALPTLTGRVARIPLRPGMFRHGTAPLSASMVVTSLRRAADLPQTGWLLAGLARTGRDVALDAVDDLTIELELKVDGVDLARVLAAAPLAIAVYGRRTERLLGTGPFELA